MCLAPALLEEISYDDDGVGNAEPGDGEDGDTVSASSIRREERGRIRNGGRGAGDRKCSDALAHVGVRHVDIPITPEKVWRLLEQKGLAGVVRKTSDNR